MPLLSWRLRNKRSRGLDQVSSLPLSCCFILRKSECPLLPPYVTVLKINNCHPGWWVKVNLNAKPTPTRERQRQRQRQKQREEREEEEDEGKRKKIENGPWRPSGNSLGWSLLSAVSSSWMRTNVVNHSLPKLSYDLKLQHRTAISKLEVGWREEEQHSGSLNVTTHLRLERFPQLFLSFLHLTFIFSFPYLLSLPF